MKTKINISIPNTCHENWQEMSVVDNAKFCNSCSKKVFDFTQATDREIVYAFEKNTTLCGRFLNSQLNRELIIPQSKSSLWLTTTSALISFFGIGINDLKAQETVKTEQTDKKVLNKSIKTENEEIEISGIVTDKTGPLPGANVIIKGTKISTQCDIDGKFKLKTTKNNVLVFSFIGYKPVEYPLNSYDKEVNIEMADMILATEVTLGGACRTTIPIKRTFFGRIFHSIGNWFT